MEYYPSAVHELERFVLHPRAAILASSEKFEKHNSPSIVRLRNAQLAVEMEHIKNAYSQDRIISIRTTMTTKTTSTMKYHLMDVASVRVCVCVSNV